jgi:CheY-like chemotaxis protein
MRILVIESDPVTADVVETTFPSEHEIVIFGAGRAALERIAVGRAFDVVFCEIDPPDITARELYERIEAGSPRTAKRIVFLVADAKSHRAFLDNKPLKHYLTRPISASALRKAIEAVS